MLETSVLVKQRDILYHKTQENTIDPFNAQHTDIGKNLKGANYLRHQSLFEFQSVWIAEDDKEVCASIPGAA